MSDRTKLDEILNYAIENEQNAVDLYTQLAEQSTNPSAKKAFLMYADEERAHKSKLQNVKAGKRMLVVEENIQDLQIADYTVDVELDENASYQDILIFAMKLEKAAFRLYTDLAEQTDDSETKQLLLNLAQEEAKHKLRFELEYDEQILTEN